jgi:hypothetical protein
VDIVVGRKPVGILGMHPGETVVSFGCTAWWGSCSILGGGGGVLLTGGRVSGGSVVLAVRLQMHFPPSKYFIILHNALPGWIGVVQLGTNPRAYLLRDRILGSPCRSSVVRVDVPLDLLHGTPPRHVGCFVVLAVPLQMRFPTSKHVISLHDKLAWWFGVLELGTDP